MNRIVFLFLAFASLFFTSCGDETSPSGELTFNLQVDGADLNVGLVNIAPLYNIGTDDASVIFDVAQFYISNLRLIDDAGIETAIGDHYLIDLSNNKIDLTDLEEATYKTIKFNVGVDPSVNHNDPSEVGDGEALGPQNPSMNWGWQAGYRFLRIDGKWDSDGNGIIQSDIDEDFQLHIGNDAYYREVEIPYEFEALGSENTALTLNVDIAVLFDYSLQDNTVVHTGMVNDLHDSISSSIAAAFSR